MTYYQNTKEKYVWPDRVSFSEIFTRKDSLAQAYLTQLNSGANFDTLASKFTERPGFKEKAGRFDLVDAKSTQLALEADKLKNLGSYSSVISNAWWFFNSSSYFKRSIKNKNF
ncbi:MAG: hypothetical protein MZV64_41030 [Ignavibacteriales bacterium]|nr:hypothetical protein [Ignavibacteriales bacterium]